MRRVCVPGIDLPAWFIHEIKGIDDKLEFIWHQYVTMYDDVMNSYSGTYEDSRHNIHNELGQELWGYPIGNLHGAPVPDLHWHIWRYAWPHGYTHVVKLESKESGYLGILLSRLHLQAHATSARHYQRLKAEEDEKQRLKSQKDIQDYKRDVDRENAPFYKKAMDNALSGHLNPTNPTKDQIISFPGQKNRSRIIRPLDDTEGGLIIPDYLKR